MVVECPVMQPYRESCGISTFITSIRAMSNQLSARKMYALYLDDTDGELLNAKTQDLLHMYIGWHNLMEIDI